MNIFFFNFNPILCSFQKVSNLLFELQRPISQNNPISDSQSLSHRIVKANHAAQLCNTPFYMWCCVDSGSATISNI